MPPPIPYFREAGTGPGVVCLHANASSSGQWRALMALLAPEFHVLAPDAYGAGRGPAWTAGRPLTLHDEAQLLEPVFSRAEAPLVLVGHSYGAAVALIAALAQPQRVRALAIYEPTLFSLLDQETPPPNQAEGIRNVAVAAGAALDAGNADGAAACFIDYWMGASTWAHMPDARKAPIIASIVNVRDWAHALFNEPTPLGAFAALDMPVLYMTGSASPASSLGVARLLTRVLPRVEVVTFDAIGHMGPVTHAAPVNDAIARFLQRI